MQQFKHGYIIFNKKTKSFYDGDGGLTENLIDSEFYEIDINIQDEIDDMDNPEEYEIWPIEMKYQTR